MASVRPLMLATFVALLAIGCRRKNPDPAYIDLRDFDSGKQLRDTLAQRFPPGSRVAFVWENMQRHGFNCGERGVLRGDEKPLIPEGRPNLECWGSNRSQPFNKRVWLVWFPFDTTTRVTTGVFAGYLGEENRRR
jgi:hypothetical protein